MANTQIFQIFYDAETKASLDPGFIPLDNMANPRPDWREYWPIRTYLLANPIDDAIWYGFFSPKFKSKTGLTAGKLEQIANESAADVILFSPSFDLHALFKNVFESGEFFHPGLTGVSQAFFDSIGKPTDLDKLITDSRNSVFSNYFVAKGWFWRRWFAVTEALFAAADTPAHPLGDALRQSAGHGGQDVPMKVFVMERIATWLLTQDANIKVQVHDPFSRPLSATVFGRFPRQAAISDALKMAYVSQAHPAYWNAFCSVREEVLRELRAGVPPTTATPGWKCVASAWRHRRSVPKCCAR